MDKNREMILNYANNVWRALDDMLYNEESDFYVNLKNVENGDITPFVTALCITHLSLLMKLCGIDGNYLDGIHFENKLVVQYLMAYGEAT